MNTDVELGDGNDSALEQVAARLLEYDQARERWGAVIRHTYDMIYNGQETGRYRWDQLMKTEKTHFGTLFEINAQREFGFEGRDEDPTDYRIAGHLVDAKWSQTDGRWMLPPEVLNQIALVATGDDERGVWSVGLVRILPEFRNEGSNRDRKSNLNKAGREAIRWLWRDEDLPPNVLLQLPKEAVDGIFRHKFGTQKTNQLFRAAEGRIVHRSSVMTVAMQLDPLKRVRYNGGSRTSLAPEGYIILSGTFYAQLAAKLGVSVPGPAEFISVRVVPATPNEGTYIDGRYWRRATPEDSVFERAPMLPNLAKNIDA